MKNSELSQVVHNKFLNNFEFFEFRSCESLLEKFLDIHRVRFFEEPKFILGPQLKIEANAVLLRCSRKIIKKF